MKHQNVPLLNASLTSVCSSGDKLSMLWIEFSPPFEEARAREARSAGESVPDSKREVKYDLTFESRTAAHCARPTVPPNARNYRKRMTWVLKVKSTRWMAYE